METANRPREARPSARVMIVDDHELAREGLRSILAGEPGVEVVAEATTGREALALCRGTRPDLILMDIRMPELDGLAATRMIKAEFPRVSVVMVTMHEEPDYLLDAIKAGAAGYVLKGSSRREILDAVRRVLRGEALLDARLVTQLLQRLASETDGSDAPPVQALTPREREVLRLVADGLTNGEIARSLTVSVSTAKAHVEHIIGKLGVSDRTQAAVRAVQLHLLGQP